MNKGEVIELFKETLNVSGSQAKDSMEKIFNTFIDKLKSGEDVLLPGIGKLYIKERAARKGRNPHTGETIQIAASKKLAVRMLKDFNETLNS